MGRLYRTQSLITLLIGSMIALCIRYVYRSGSEGDNDTHASDSEYGKGNKQEQIGEDKGINISVVLLSSNGIEDPTPFKSDSINQRFLPCLDKIALYHRDLLGNQGKKPKLPDCYYDEDINKQSEITINDIMSEKIKTNNTELLNKLGKSKNIPFDFFLNKEKEIYQFRYSGDIENKNDMNLLCYHMDGFSSMILYLGINIISGDNLMMFFENIHKKLELYNKDDEKEEELLNKFHTTDRPNESDNAPDVSQTDISTCGDMDQSNVVNNLD